MSETNGVQIIDLESALRRSLGMRNPNQAAQAILSTESEIRGLREVNADLLAACKEAERHHQGHHSKVGKMLRAVIAKAEGRS